MSIVTPKYKYNSLIDIDSETLDYLNFVIPGGNLYATSIDDVKTFLNNLDDVYAEFEREKRIA